MIRLLSAAIFVVTLAACVALDCFAASIRFRRWLEKRRDERQWIAYLDRADAERRALASPRVLPGPPRASTAMRTSSGRLVDRPRRARGPGNPPTNWRN